MSENMKMTKAILQLVPDAKFVLSGTDYENIKWLDEQAKPTVAEINVSIANLLPEPLPTVADKLASVGLSVTDLKAALGL
jgi:hypothetical protein